MALYGTKGYQYTPESIFVMRPIRRPCFASSAIALVALISVLQDATSPARAADDWDNSEAQKTWGLMQVWGTVKYNFAFFDQVPGLDWDATVRAAIPRVLAAKTRDDFYRRLNELTALLHDGHTLVVSPSLMNGENDNPPIELQMVENTILVVRVGDSTEVRAQGIRPGMELIAADGVPAHKYLEQHALRYYSGSTPQNGEAFGMFLVLNGPRNSMVALTLKDIDGRVRTVELARNSRNSDGTSFKYRIFDHSPLVESRTVGDGIAYIRIATFGVEDVVNGFDAELDKLDADKLRGMILDLRYNMGGDDTNAYPIISRLVDHPVPGPRWSTRKYLPAFASWGRPEEWHQGNAITVEPSAQKRYLGPLVLLTGPNTMSTSEDLLVYLDYSGRALLVGETTAGTTGNPVDVALPGGAILKVCSKRDEYPDGRQFVGIGIQPDIPVHPTVAGILADRDEVLERAVYVLRHWNKYKAMAAYRNPQKGH